MVFQLALVQTLAGSPRTLAKNVLVSQNHIQDLWRGRRRGRKN
jgi:hypothetical protein